MSEAWRNTDAGKYSATSLAANCCYEAILAKVITKSFTMALHNFTYEFGSTHPILPSENWFPLEYSNAPTAG